MRFESKRAPLSSACRLLTASVHICVLGLVLVGSLLSSALSARADVGGHGAAVEAHESSSTHVSGPIAPESSMGDRLLKLFSDTTFQGMVFNFGCLLLLIYYGARGPLSAFLKQRRATIFDQLEEAKRLREEAERMHREYEQKLGALDQELERIRSETKRAGEAERQRISEETEAKSALMRNDAEFLISQQFKQIQERLTKETVVAALSHAEEILHSELSPLDQQRLTEAYVTQLGPSIRGGGRA
ncbi:MAG: hypothetical protein AAF355_05485 [Myxococcota bacterium]